MRRLLPPTLVLLLAISTTAMHFVMRLPVAPTALRLSGVPVAVVGLSMSIWGSRRFAEVGTNIQTFDQPDLLVSDGLFRWSRNPMYLGFVIFLVGVALGLGSLIGVMSPVVFFLAADRWYVPFEEKEMRQTFKEQYEDYSRLVLRWVGRRAG